MKALPAVFFLLSLGMILLYILDKCQMNCRAIFDRMANLLLGPVAFCLAAVLSPWKSKILKHRPLQCTACLQ